MAAQAQAVVIRIDDFATNSTPVFDLTNNGNAVTGPVQPIIVNGRALTRQLSINLTSALPPVQDNAIVSDGVYDLTNGVGDQTEARLIYAIDGLAPAFPRLGDLSDLTLLLRIVESDGNPSQIETLMNGNSLAVTQIAPNTMNQPISVPLDPTQQLNGSLQFVLTGAPGYDITLNLIAVNAVPNNLNVPAPSALVLFGLGLIGLSARRRAK